MSRIELSLISSISTLLLPSISHAVPGSVLTVESSNPELDPEELPADTLPLLLPPLSTPAAVNLANDDDDDEGAAATDTVVVVVGATAAAGEDIVLGIFEGCVSHSLAS